MNTSPEANPWLLVPRRAPFILPSDRAAIAKFNESATDQFQIKTHLLPIPFIGNPDAPVVLLSLNPGYHPEDDVRQATPKFTRACRDGYAHAASEHPFFFFAPRIEGADEGPGQRWWRRRFPTLKGLNDLSSLAGGIFCVQYFPYRSRSFDSFGSILDSQHYGFDLVRGAMRRGAEIVLMRSRRRWFDAIPKLADYRRLVELPSPRNPTLTEQSAPAAFARLTRMIKRS